MPKIQLLDDQTINQIAAGEVIEDPASVVKELLENALDAGATSILVETQGGGRGLIRVSDDGCGMDQEDLCLALQRHATSKIQNVDDLEHLHTLGFRGEALPSIASVSKLSLQSSLEDKGAAIDVAGGKIGRVVPIPRTRGTTVEVRSLFYNVPVRRKFQKSLAADVAEIHKCLTKVALAHNGLHIRWIHEGKTQFELAKEMSLLERIRIVLGAEFAEQLIHIEGLGYIGKPTFHRPNRTGQYLAINQRAVVCPFISQKVLEAYSTRLPVRRFPVFVLHLPLAPDWIDVNVHPQKREVRLREKEKIASIVMEGIEKALHGGRSSLMRVVFEPPLEQMGPTSVSEEEIPYQVPLFEEQALLPPPLQVLGIVGDAIITQEDKGLCLYSSEAIFYRLHFDMLQESKVEQQVLLFPQTIEVTAAESMFLMQHLERLNDLGIAIRHFGEQTFIIDAIPVYLEFEEIPSLIQTLFEQEPTLFAKVIARRGKKKVESVSQAAALLKKVEKTTQTPDGKPLFISISEDEIRKRFEKN